MSIQKVITKKMVYTGPFLKVREDRYIENKKEKIYNVVERENSVIIIPLSKNKKTILLKQLRYPTHKFSLEFPMGGHDVGETKLSAAKRELKEETGIQTKKLIHIGKFYPIPGLTPQNGDVYLAEVSDMDLNNANTSEGEIDIKSLSIVSLESVFNLVTKGKITDGSTLSGLLLLEIYLKNNNK